MQLTAVNSSESSTRPAAPVVPRRPARRVPGRRRKPGRRAGRRAVVAACPACGSPVRGRAAECPHCGAYIDARARREMEAGRRVVRRYQLGMRILGGALVVIGCISLLVAIGLALILGVLMAPTDLAGLGIVVGFLAVLVLILGIPLWLGICAFKYHNWVNWVVAIYYGLGLLGTIFFALKAGQMEVSFGALIELALFATAVVNIVNVSRIRQLGLDARFGAKLNISRRPRARVRR
jgi:hypothetical protein